MKYVFHSIQHVSPFVSRVYGTKCEIHTLVLAVQNLEATTNLAREEMVEWTALQGSLATMSKGE